MFKSIAIAALALGLVAPANAGSNPFDRFDPPAPFHDARLSIDECIWDIEYLSGLNINAMSYVAAHGSPEATTVTLNLAVMASAARALQSMYDQLNKDLTACRHGVPSTELTSHWNN